MITYLETSVFDSPAQTLVNTVNTVGVMGKGIAKEFKQRHPAMYREYRALCDANALRIGLLHLWRGDKRWVLNFPTKTTWRQPSKIRYIEDGLAKFVSTYHQMGITSISFPPLGCGNGNLDWHDVKPIMDEHLRRIDIPVYIHDVQVGEDFVPEHLVGNAPDCFDSFWNDILQVVHKHKGTFYTSQDGEFSVIPSTDPSDRCITVTKEGHRRRIEKELIEESWITLRDRYLTNQSFPDESSRKLKSYFFPILTELPYVRRAVVRHPNSQNARSDGLFINKESFRGYQSDSGDNQGCLSL